MSSDYNSGFDAGQRGNIFGPATAEGTAGWMAGNALRNTKSSGSAEWIVAPFVLWPFVMIFYPVGALATVATAYAMEKLTKLIGLGGIGGIRWPLVLIATVIACWTVVRMEQRWGLNRTYYRVRHVVRMLIFALLANGAAQSAGRDAHYTGWDATLAWPPHWMAIGVMLIFWQLLFMRAYDFRVYWNQKLISWFFRPKEFEPFYFRDAPVTKFAERKEPIAMPGFGRHDEP